ncbi:MAG: hypothetical protein V8Q79_08790 [Christensenellales bacterium]
MSCMSGIRKTYGRAHRRATRRRAGTEAGFSAKQYNHVLPPEGMLTEEEAIALARQALVNDGGLTLETLDDEESEIYASLHAGRKDTSFGPSGIIARWASASLKISAENGEILDVIVDYGMAGNG